VLKSSTVYRISVSCWGGGVR